MSLSKLTSEKKCIADLNHKYRIENLIMQI